jgi:two-component system alkaline phosphatase synthesis response regulator PhoP
MKKRILIVDDEQQMCMILGDRLRSEGYAVEFAFDGKSGAERIGKTAFDLIILDIMLPVVNGLDLCMQMRKSGISTPVIFLTARSQSLEKVRGFNAGADDYVTKPFEMLELMARVESLLRRSPSRQPNSPVDDLIKFGTLTLDVRRKNVIYNGRTVTLMPREFEMLRYLAERSGQTVSREELLERVWGKLSGNLTRTVDMHVANVRHKLETDPKSPELVLTDPGEGYRFQEPFGP